MTRPNFEPIFSEKSEFCEKSSHIPVKSFVPHQSMTLSELMHRFESGQRLNVHQSPMNVFYSSEEDAANQSETFDDAPPTDCFDLADVQHYYEQHQEKKHDFEKRQKQAQQDLSKQAQQPADTTKVESNPSD